MACGTSLAGQAAARGPASAGDDVSAAGGAASPALAPPTVPAVPAQDARAEYAERRQLTVLFCDLADSTALAGAYDPEDLRELVRAYHQAAGAVIRQYEGHIAQYLGDGLLVYFGYPRAHEDAGTRAVRTAQGIVDALPALNARLALHDAHRLRVRIGIHTGLVVVGDVGMGSRHEQLAIGETPNIAARLQSAAPHDGVVASADTRHLVRDGFDWRDLGLLQLKGLAHPLQAFALRLGAAGPADADTDGAGAALTSADLPPLVGRESESAFLGGAWDSARAGAGTVVLVGGEPGIGKSRLLAAARQLVARDGGDSLQFRCSPYHGGSELHPLKEWMVSALGFMPAEPAAARFHKIEVALARAAAGQHPDELGLLAALLSVPLPAGFEAPRLTPAIAKQRTQDALVRWLLAQAVEQPLLIGFEDLHWADPSTLALIQALAAEVGAERVMLVATFRPEFDPPWPASARTVRLALERLPATSIEAIARRLAGGRSLPEAVMRQIVANTDGVPLFVEEFTRSLLESGALVERGDRFELRGDLLTGMIPLSLRDSLAARLDRLGAGRVLARHAAVVGRRFEASLVGAVAGMAPHQVDEGVQELLQAGLVYRVDAQASPDRYEFKHALVQAAAYESLLKRERIALHARVGQEIVARQPELAESQPELVAYHLGESQQWGAAVQHWLLAGGRSLARSANAEAITQLSAGLALVDHVPVETRAGLELALLSTIGPALIATTGFGSAAVGEVYQRARALCELMQDRPEFFPSLWGSWVYHLVSGQLGTSREIAEQMLQLGQRTGDPALLVEAHWTLGNSLFWMGELEAANAQLALSPSFYDAQAHAGNALVYGQDPAVAAECYRCYALYALGHVDQAVASLERATVLAGQRDHIFTTGWVLAFRFMLHLFRREPAQALEAADRTLAFSSEHGHAFWTAAALTARGWARARTLDREGGVAELRAGIAAYDLTGSKVVQALWYSLLAELELDAGHWAEADAALESGFAIAAETGERVSEIELWRIRGEWHARQPVPALGDARRCLAHALALAQACGARSYALRAATAWHRLLASHPDFDGTGAGANTSPLPALLGSFNEGLDTADLVEARRVLAPPGAMPRAGEPA
jgi:class 3 adenylate cyclase/predicted ATPase